MALRRLIVLAVLLLSIRAHAQSVPDQLAESNSPITDVAIIVSNGTGDVTDNQTWGRPRALLTYNLATVLLYAQGLPELINPKHDEVWLFRNPNTPTGYSTEYTGAAPVRILPAVSGIGSNVDMNYAHHWPYKMHGRYYMVAQEAADPSNDNFHFYLLGKSTDGINWTWRRWLHVREGITLDQLAWKDISIGGTTYNYGFVSGLVGPIGLSAIRFKQDGTAGGDWAFDTSSGSTALAIWSNNSWVTVPTCASIGDTSGYDFCMYRQPSCGQVGGACPDDKKIDPQIFLTNGRHPSLHRLEKHGNKYELWYHSTLATTGTCGYEDPDDPTLNNANTFTYRQFTPPTTLTQDPATTVGPALFLKQEAVGPIRCMPARYRSSRATPFRLEWTFDMLYSRTGDSESDPFSTTTYDPHHYIVRTRLEKEGTP